MRAKTGENPSKWDAVLHPYRQSWAIVHSPLMQKLSSSSALLSPLASEPGDEASLMEEAARYALLRRLTPTLRHHLVGEFQPIGMIAAMVDRRLQAEQLNLASLRENSAALGKLSRAAASNCMNIMTWIAPKGASSVGLEAGVQECLGLLSTEFRFKGLVIVNEVHGPALDGAGVEVPLNALRSVLPAALLALSDETQGAADLRVVARPMDGAGVQLLLTRHAADRPADNGVSAEYRALTWRDVEVLAHAESVGYARLPDGVQLTLHCAPLTAH